MRPEDFKYTDSHEWVMVEDDIAIVGITDFAVQELTDLVYVELPVPGDTVEKGEPFGEVESVKTVAELYAPVSGEIIEVNEDLPEDLDLLSNSPFGEGWMIKVKMEDSSELDELLSKSEYDEIAA